MKPAGCRLGTDDWRKSVQLTLNAVGSDPMYSLENLALPYSSDSQNSKIQLVHESMLPAKMGVV